MKRTILLLLIMVYNSGSYPTTEPGVPAANDKDTAKKVIGSSVVTSVSVILNGNEPQFTDAIGNSIPKPLVPLQVASPINLLNPDRYEFYTFNDNGELEKRLMTMDEIQSIVANGNGDGAVIHSFPINDRDPEKNVHDIVESVQKVLNKEVAWKKNMTNEHLVLDTPDVSSSWSMILPAIFGNTGTEIFPNRPQQVAMTPDTDVMTKMPPTKAPQTHKTKPQKPVPSVQDKKKPSMGNVPQGTVNNMKVNPTFNRPELTKPISRDPVVVHTTTKIPSTTAKTTTTTTTAKPTTSAPTKPTTTATPTTARTTTTTHAPTTSSTTTTTTKPVTEKARPTTTTTLAPPVKTVSPMSSSTSTSTEASVTKAPQSAIPVTAVDIKPTSEVEFSEYHHYEPVPLASTGGYGGLEADDIAEDSSIGGYFSPSLESSSQIKDDINTQISIDQILETLKNDINTEKIEIETNTKQFTTVEPMLYKGDLSKPNKMQEVVIRTTEAAFTTTTIIPEMNTEDEPISTESAVPQASNTLQFEPLFAEIKDPVLADLTTELATTEASTVAAEPTTEPDDQFNLGNHDGFESYLQALPLKAEDRPFSIVQTIDHLISDHKNSTSSNVDVDHSSLVQNVKVQASSNEISMDDYVQHAHTIASNLEGSSDLKTTTQSGQMDEINETEESNEISNLIPDIVNQITDTPHIDIDRPDRPDEHEEDNRVSNFAYLNPDLQIAVKETLKNKNQKQPEKTLTTQAPERLHTTTAAPEAPVTHTRFNLRPTYQSHTKLSDESASHLTTQTEPNSSIEVNTPHFVKIQSIKAEAYLSTSESNKVSGEPSTTVSSTSIASEEVDDDETEQESTENADETSGEVSTAKPIASTIAPISHETEQAYVKLGESTERLDEAEASTTTMSSVDTTNIAEVTTLSDTTVSIKESSSNTLKPVHYYKHPLSATDQKLMQFNNQRPVVRPPALSNLKVTPVGQPPRVPVKLDPIPGPALGLKSSTMGQDEDVLAFAQLCNELAFNYWKSITAEKISTARSLVISPFALTSMLSMVFLGARGGTSGEMNEILKLDDMVTFNPHLVFKNITDSVEKIRDSHISAAAFVREVYTDRANGKVLQFFKEKVQQFYSGHVEEVNFNIVSDIIRRRTNLLVKRHTAGKVPEYMRTNSVWVNGPFATISANLIQTDCTRGSVFDRDGEMFFQVHPSIRQRRLVPIPAVVWRIGFTAGYDPEVDATVVAFGSALDTISIVYVMPGQQGLAAPGDSLERLESSLIETEIGTNAWGRLLSSLSERPGLEVQIPRFSHRSFVNASAGLQRMGLRSIFNSDDADLRGLTGSSSRDVYLSDMIQVNTFTTCGEGRIGDQHHVEMYPAPPLRRKQSPIGQEARSDGKSEAVTASVQDSGRAIYDDLLDPKYLEVPLQLRPRQARIPDAPRLRFDKPFLYFVRHNPTGMILFMGRFNPRLLP